MTFQQAAGSASRRRMRCGWLASVLLAAQCALAGDVIRLRSRVIQPIEGQRVRSISPGEAGSFRQTHFLLQFSAYPGPELRRELSRRGLRVLGYVPDSGLTVACRRPVDLSDLDVTWAGNLSATDKLSPTLGSTPAPGYLVVFFADVDMDVARALAARHGFGVIENRGLLRSQLILAGSAAGLKELAAEDEVSYILPASPDLVSGMPVTGCAGALAEAGPVAEYVAVGRGWAKDAGGAAALKYYIQNASPKMDQNGQRSEIERALREWARYANVTFTPGSQPAVARTIAIQFAGRSHGDAYPFDGLGGTLAHTFYPSPPNPEPVAGDMHFDADENWRIGADTDLFTVALHEAGHALGLGHSDRPGSVMYPYYRFATGLTDDDIAGAQALYGKAGASIPAPPTTPGTPATPPATPGKQADTTPPALKIQTPGFTIVSTSSAAIAMSGTASDNVGVAAVKWSVSTGGSGDAVGTTAWSARVPLLTGTNVVTLRAYDAAGNSGWRTITVVRR